MQNKSTQEFDDIIRNIIENQKVQEMKKYKQHYETSTFDHCYMVSYYCYKVCKKLKLDYKSAARAGMLHDFFLYDWRIKNGRKVYMPLHMEKQHVKMPLNYLNYLKKKKI